MSNVDKHLRSGEVRVRLCNYLDVYQEDYLDDTHAFTEGTATDNEISKFGLRSGDVVVTKDSETPFDIGVAAVIEAASTSLVCGYHLAILRPTAGTNPVWLAKEFGSARIQTYLAGRATGSTRYGLSNSALASVPIWVPERHEQDHAVELLRTVDRAICHTERVIGKLELIKRGLLRDVLTRGIDESGEVRDQRRHPERFRESTVGQIPREWDVITLEEAGTWMSGGTPSKAVPAFWNGPIPCVSPKDMKSLWLDRTIDSISQQGAASGGRIAPAGSVMIVVRGMILAHSFPVAIISRPMAFNQDIKTVVASAIQSRFLAFWLVASAARFLGLVSESTHGTKRIELRDLHRQSVPRPPPDEQDRILTVLLSQEARIEVERDTLAKLRLVKEGLADDVLTGRVRVTKLPEGETA